MLDNNMKFELMNNALHFLNLHMGHNIAYTDANGDYKITCLDCY